MKGGGLTQGSERLRATQSSAFYQSVPDFGWHRRLNLCSNVRLWCSLLLHVTVPNTTGVNSLPFMYMTQLLWKLVSTWKPGEQAVHPVVENSYLYFSWSMILNLGYTLKSSGSLKNGDEAWFYLKSIEFKFLKVMPGIRFVLKISHDNSNAQLGSGRPIWGQGSCSLEWKWHSSHWFFSQMIMKQLATMNQSLSNQWLSARLTWSYETRCWEKTCLSKMTCQVGLLEKGSSRKSGWILSQWLHFSHITELYKVFGRGKNTKEVEWPGVFLVHKDQFVTPRSE